MIVKRNAALIKTFGLLSDSSLRLKLHIILAQERNAKPIKSLGKWQIKNKHKLPVYRWKRLALAKEYKKRNNKLSPILFEHVLPSWRNWPGTMSLFSTNIYKETKEGYVYSHTEQPK